MTQAIYRSTAGRDAIMALYDRVLAGWPVPSEHLHLPTRYGDTFVIASKASQAAAPRGAGGGGATPLVLLHGSGSNSASWAHDVIEYSRHRPVYAVDIPGEPGKSAPVRFSCRGPAFGEWLDDVLDGLGLQQAILGGMSLGGWAALDYAIRRPERVAGAVLICPSGICAPRLSFFLAAILYLPLGDWGIDRMQSLIFKNAPVSEDAEKYFVLVARHFNYRAEAPRNFSDEELRSASMPVLFLAGEHDAVLQSRKSAERLTRLLPNVTAHVYREDGHALIDMAAEAEAFLDGVGRVAVPA